MTTTNPVSGIFNVGTGTGLSLRDILTHISKVVGREPTVEWLASRSFDVPKIVLDTTKLKKATEWRVLTSLQDGVGITADWLRNTDI